MYRGIGLRKACCAANSTAVAPARRARRRRSLDLRRDQSNACGGAVQAIGGRARSLQPACRLVLGRRVALHPDPRRALQPAARRVHAGHRLRAVHARHRSRRGLPRRPLVVETRQKECGLHRGQQPLQPGRRRGLKRRHAGAPTLPPGWARGAPLKSPVSSTHARPTATRHRIPSRAGMPALRTHVVFESCIRCKYTDWCRCARWTASARDRTSSPSIRRVHRLRGVHPRVPGNAIVPEEDVPGDQQHMIKPRRAGAQVVQHHQAQGAARCRRVEGPHRQASGAEARAWTQQSQPPRAGAGPTTTP